MKSRLFSLTKHNLFLLIIMLLLLTTSLTCDSTADERGPTATPIPPTSTETPIKPSETPTSIPPTPTPMPVPGIDEPITLENVAVKDFLGNTWWGDIQLQLLKAYTKNSLDSQSGTIFPRDPNDFFLLLELELTGQSGSLEWTASNATLTCGKNEYKADRFGIDIGEDGKFKSWQLIFEVLQDSDLRQGVFHIQEHAIELTTLFLNAGEPEHEADQDTSPPWVDELECLFDDGTQRNYFTIESMFIDHEVQVDGEINSVDEWSKALCVDLRFYEGNDYNSPNVHQARWWVQNDDQFVYFLVRVPKDLPLDGVAVDYFWPRYTGTWEHSDVTFVDIEGELFDGSNWDEVDFYDDVELTPQGSINFEAVVREDGNFYWFEIKKELDSGDPYDWEVKPGQIIGNHPSDSLLFALIFEDTFFARKIQLHLGEP